MRTRETEHHAESERRVKLCFAPTLLVALVGVLFLSLFSPPLCFFRALLRSYNSILCFEH